MESKIEELLPPEWGIALLDYDKMIGITTPCKFTFWLRKPLKLNEISQKEAEKLVKHYVDFYKNNNK